MILLIIYILTILISASAYYNILFCEYKFEKVYNTTTHKYDKIIHSERNKHPALFFIIFGICLFIPFCNILVAIAYFGNTNDVVYKSFFTEEY